MIPVAHPRGPLALPGLLLTLPTLLAALALHPGCTVGPNHRPPPPPALLPASFSHAPTNAFHPDAVDARWWQSFQDPTLDRLIALASTNNPDLRIAEARLREARALWTAARLDFAPTVRSDAAWQKSRLSTANRRGEALANRDQELFRAGFDATWELDLWGRVRRSVEATRATIDSVQATRDNVLVSLRAEVAGARFDARGLQAQLAVASLNATNQAQTLALAETLRDAGAGTQLDVARARALLHNTLAGIPLLEAALDRTRHRLAVLCGLPPSALPDASLASPDPLPARPANPTHRVLSIGTPADLLRRRPDVRAAEHALAAATARIGIEVADLYPRITLNGSLGLQAEQFSGLSKGGAEASSFGPHLTWAAFDLGRVRQRIHAANARADAALATFERTVLLALEETENSLVALSRERTRLDHLRESERSGLEAVELARQRYRDGISDFISVLDAERTLLGLQDQRVVSETRAATHLVAVYKALAGGWEP